MSGLWPWYSADSRSLAAAELPVIASGIGMQSCGRQLQTTGTKLCCLDLDGSAVA